ncbi:hypothetical protein [Blastococcus sp. SYSU D00820]
MFQAPSRRALGLAAVGAIAMSTAVLSVSGVASALPAEPQAFGFTTDADRATENDLQLIGGSGFTVPAGYCSVDWFVLGGNGGYSQWPAESSGASGGILEGRTPVTAGQTYHLSGGTAGEPGTETEGGAGGTSTATPPVPGQPGVPIEEEEPDPLPPALAGATTVVGGGGGGGAGSVVSGPDGFLLKAFGGDGGGGEAGGAGAVVGTTPGQNVVNAPGWEVVTNGVNDYGSDRDGIIEGYVEPCAVLHPPLAPTGVTVVDGVGEVEVTFAEAWDDEVAAADEWEYRLNGGAWTTADVDTSAYPLTFVADGLTNGTAYDIQVRGVSDTDGPGAASAVVTGRPYAPASAPTGVTVTPGVASVKVGWAPVTTPGSYAIDHYAVDLIWSGGEMGGREQDVCAPALDVFSCVVGLDTQAGYTYQVVVTTVDVHGHVGDDSTWYPVGAPADPAVPSSVPASNGPLQLPAGQSSTIAAGSKIVLSGDGYLPGSTVTLIAYSSPQVLGYTVADANGHFEVEVTVPAGLASGSHTLVASGVDSAGNTRFVTVPITVTGGVTGSGGLAYTGADIAVPAFGGLAALAIGGGLVLAGKRRRTAAE